MLPTFFRFSSCRGIKTVANKFTVYNTEYLFHNLKEIIYFTNLLEGTKFDRKINTLLTNEENFFNKIHEIKQNINNSDFIYIEISTLTYYMDKNGNIGQAERIKEQMKLGNVMSGEFINYKITENEFVEDIKYLQNYFNKPILFTGHITSDCKLYNNLQFWLKFIEQPIRKSSKEEELYYLLESRKIINNYLEKHTTNFIIIENIIKDYPAEDILIDTVHYTPKGYDVLYENVNNIIPKIK
jgi:hypothetical protein